MAPQDKSMPIAVVGMGFRGPADATNVERLWGMILEGREAWSPIPKARWNNPAFYHPDNARHGTTNVQGGHFMAEDPSLFDAPFFNMTGDEAAAMDPQQRLLLEVTYEGLENAGIPLPNITGTKTACFVGSFSADYTDLLLRDPESVPMYQCTNAGQSRAMTANRVSYFFDLKGPSVTVDTACSGSLVALHLACQSIRTGDASMAIAAGVNVILSHEFMSTMSMMKFLSPDGRCYTFDEAANGYARGEAIGCLILKPLEDALRDGDTIRAVIRGSGSNQDGRTPGITLPSGALQETLIRDVYKAAGLNPLETEYVETHGTGTQAGDPIETGALSKVFGPGRPSDTPLRIGSIKTNVGHLEGTSGVAGVMKAVLMLENRVFLPNRNFTTLNPRIPLCEWNLKVQLEPERWTSSGPHRISVNSFGYGGSNAHIVLEDAKGYLSSRNMKGRIRRNRDSPLLTNGAASEHSVNGTSQPARTRLFVLSGFDENSCAMQAQRLREYLVEKRPNEESMNDLAYTLNERRTKFMWKAAVTGSSSSVADTLSGKVTPKRAAKKPNIGFVFTGQGAQWCGMGKELCEEYPVFRQSLKRIDAYLRKIDAPFTVEDEVLRGKDSSRLSHPLLSQPVCSALQISLVDLLASWGVFPDSVTGHSSGEIAAAYAVGALCMEDAMSIAYHRGSVAGKLSMTGDVNGAMLAVSMSTDDIQPYLGTLRRGKVVVACKNSPSSLTISGDQTAIEEMEQMLHEKQVFCRRLAVGVAYHSHHMKLIGDEYRAAIAHVKTRSEESKSYRQTVSFFSSVTGTETPSSELGPDYWVRNLLGQVKFVESLQTLSFETNTQKHAPVPTGKRMKRVGAARKVSIDFLIEIGPHSALAGPIKQIIKADSKLSIADITYGSVLIRKSDAVATALALATSLVTSGCSLAFDAINRPSKHRDPQLLVDLPPYPWNHSRSYWAEPRMSKAFRGRRCPRADILGVSDTMSCPFEPRWRNFLRVSEIPWLSDHKIQSNIVYPAAGYIAMVIEASSQLALVNSGKEITGYQLRDVSILSALVINETSAVEIMVSLRPCKSIETVTEYEFHIYSTTDENRWTEHCRGVVGAGNYETGPDEIKHSQHTADLSVLDVGKFYEDLSHVGLEYGPCFANMTQARFAEDVCHAEIAIPDTAATMPMNFQHPFLVHPCTLDSTFHSIFVPVLAKMGRTEEPPVPIHIDQIYVSRSISTSPGTRMEVQASVIQEEDSDIVASLEAIERNSGTVVSITGLTCRRISDSSNSVSNPVDRVAYNFKWEADPDLIPNESLSNLLGTVSDMTKSDLYEQCARYYVEKALSSQSDITMKPYQQRLRSLFQAQRYECTSVETGGIDLKQVKYSGPTGKLLCTLGERIPELMKAEVGPDFDVLNEYLDNASHLVQGYQAASRYLDMLAHKTPSMSVLEIGGTGAASLMFLEQLTGESDILRCAEYTFTHPDASMVESASKALDKWGSRIRSKGLSIEASLETQYFGQQTYDVVIVPYGLYAAVSKRQALKNIRKLLRSNGHLILIDPTSTRSLTNAVIFGHLSAWDETLEDALHEAQFAESAVVKCGDSGSTCSVVISRPLRETRRPSMSVLIIAEDDCGVSIRGLQDHLSLLPIKVEVSDIAHAKPNGRVCIVLSDLKASLFAHPDPKLLEALKQVFLQSAGVLWVTRGGTINATNPDAGLVTGFARTARSESGVSPIVTLDLDGQNMVSRHHAAAIIINLFRHRFIENNTTDDVEYVEKGGVLLIPRVVENIQLNQSIASLHDHNMLSEQAFHQAGRALRMVKRGENIHFVDSRVGLSDGWIGVKVRAIYLDDLKVSKLDPGCSGIVCSIQGVCGFAPGDRVAYLGSGVTNMYYDRETMFQKIPSGMSLEMAAALPAAYSTAFYIVNHLARISSDDIVLVHGASGPNGQSLVELCHMKQAQVFATVAASQKDLLSFRYGIPESQVFDQSETLIRALEMAGRRVDVIINCNGPDKQTPWKFIAPYGQYIQLGREKAEAPRSDVVVSSFDLQTLRRQNPGVLARVWKQVMSLFHEGKLKGPSPLPTYSISNVGQILKSGPQTELLITAGQDDVVQATLPKRSSDLLRPDASYMLVGGLGGIGRAMALWMADHGARHLIFASRSGMAHAAAQDTVQALQGRGVHVLVQACNVSDHCHVERMVSELQVPPIRGVIQAAMVLRDIHIEKMTADDYHSVLQPKYAATWNLHRYLPPDMDFFLMLSSISGVIGNATQSAYAAGSTFMDSFAAYRKSVGLPAVSLDLGVITDVGYLAENTELAEKMAHRGFKGTDTSSLMSLIEAAIGSGTNSQIITGLGEWKEGQALGNFDAPLFAHFRHQFSGSTADSEAENSSETLREDLRLAKTMDEASSSICQSLSVRIASHLSVPVESINPSSPISEYGIDSHAAVELRNWVSKEMESTVPILDILASGSLLELSSKIASKSQLVHLED